MEIKKILGETLKEVRKSRKLTQTVCAKRIRITQAQWSAYEFGKSTPNMEGIFQLSKGIGVHRVVLLCKFLINAKKFGLVEYTTFNEYMEIITLAPKLIKKPKVIYEK